MNFSFSFSLSLSLSLSLFLIFLRAHFLAVRCFVKFGAIAERAAYRHFSPFLGTMFATTLTIRRKNCHVFEAAGWLDSLLGIRVCPCKFMRSVKRSLYP
jgi:hypothetical protein